MEKDWRVTHGESRSRTYKAWSRLRQRQVLGELGDKPLIDVDPRWKRFEHFFADMGRKPPGVSPLTLRDTQGPYTRENCYWKASDANH